jgi:hypothetical protein
MNEDEKKRLDKIEDAYVFGRGEDPWCTPMYVPRWLYVLMLLGSMVTIGLLSWGWR